MEKRGDKEGALQKNKGFETEMRNRKVFGFKLFILIPKLETVLVVSKIETE